MTVKDFLTMTDGIDFINIYNAEDNEIIESEVTSVSIIKYLDKEISFVKLFNRSTFGYRPSILADIRIKDPMKLHGPRD